MECLVDGDDDRIVRLLRNALDQVRREVIQRYDLKNSHVDLTQEKTQLVLVTGR